MTKLWGGRFTASLDPLVEVLTSSLSVDWRLAKHDVIASIAHAKMLGKCRIISAADSRHLVRGLTALLKEILTGRFVVNRRAEDIHTDLLERLEKKIGPVAKRLHTARSRNDQVSVDLRLYGKEAVGQLDSLVAATQRALVKFAKAHRAVVIPGYTHLQRAQPILLAHQVLAYVEMLERDRRRLQEVLAAMDALPLGAGALAGTSLPIDRAYAAKLLGFARVAENSLDAVGDRDFVVELLSAIALLGMHLSRLAEDWILYTTSEFGFFLLDDAVATGSSLMPHKKNPDVLELIRGGTGILYGHLVAVLTTLKGLPTSYQRDLQWDKAPLFGALDLIQQELLLLQRVIAHVRVNRERIEASLRGDSLWATDVAEYLVGKGLAFRDAHTIVGRLIRLSEEQRRPLSRFSLSELRRFAAQFDADVFRRMDAVRSVHAKRSSGSTNPAQVARALANWERKLGRV